MIDSLVSWGPLGLAAAAFLAGSLVPLPSELVLVALVALGRNAMAMIVIATSCNVLGAATLLACGRSGRDVSERHVDRELLERAERHFRRFGVWLLLLSWLPLIGDPIVLIAGAFRVPWRVALPLLTIGKAARYVVVAVGALALRAGAP